MNFMTDKHHPTTVLIAMTGGIESTVSAYLLKKQGYKCIGVGLQLFNEDEEAGPFADMAVIDLERVKSICNYLDIPFYGVNASELFSDKVLDPLVGRILSGQTFEPLVYLNAVLLEVLLEKADKFQAAFVATAHYAKVLKNQKSGAFELFVANDLENDQSYSLAKLEQKHLERLLLPLSEIRKKEVEKISKLINIEFLPRIKSKYAHIMHDPRMVALVEERAPKDLRRPGTIYDYRSDTSICEHQGIHQYHVGQTNLMMEKKNELQIDPLKQVVSIVPFKGNIFIDYPNKLKYNKMALNQFQSVPNMDLSLPISCFVKTAAKGEKVPCRLYFKNNDMVLVEFNEEREGLLIPGQFAVFYTKKSDRAKILGSGVVEVAGMFDETNYNTLPDKREDTGDDNEPTKQNAHERMRF
jgi:tRNA-specific 2-thiouridylase